MVETRMPDPSGAPLDPAVTPPAALSASAGSSAPQYSSRRELRAAEAAQGRRVSIIPTPAIPTPAVPAATPSALSSIFPAPAADSHAQAPVGVQIAAEAQASAENPTSDPTAAPVSTGAAFFVGGEGATESVSVAMAADAGETADIAGAGETAAVVSKPGGVSRRLRGIRNSLRSSRGIKAAAFSANGPAATAEATRTRKNPFSVLVTMLAVTGLFAVAALPAYGLVIDPVAQDAVAATAAVKDTIVPVQSMSVGIEATPTETVRDGFTATTREQLDALSRSSAKAATCSAYNASGSANIGDDYPWPCELSDDEGGGLSPLNYFYRECVDFVAWRLNRDAGSFSAPFTFVWSNLTPSGGNASQWRYAWESHGWATSNTPAVGWVAWFNGNHVAYVSAVNADGTILIEEYNYGSNHRYGQRTLAASDVPLFLSPPPR